MNDRKKVMSDLEGLTFDDWRKFHSESEVQIIAKNALQLLKEQEAKTVLYMEKRSVIPVKTLSGFCPKCNHTLMYGMNKHFCGNCGRELKWNADGTTTIPG